MIGFRPNMSCFETTEVLESISGTSKIFTLFNSLDLNPVSGNTSSFIIQRELLFTDNFIHIIGNFNLLKLFPFDFTFLDPMNIYLYLHGNRELPIAQSVSSIVLRGGKMYRIHFTKWTTRLLPPPYDTNCHSYTYWDHLGQSQFDCIAKCKAREAKILSGTER